MNNRLTIIAGLIFVLFVLTSPVWYALYTRAGGSSGVQPDLEPPAGALLFSVPWSAACGESEEDIDWKRLWEQIESHQVSLSDEARLTKDAQGGKWRIVDQKNPCLVVKMQETLNIYAGCVEDKDYMNANHIELLTQWRDAVVREGDKKPHVSVASGKSYEKSLTKTCMGCHTNRETFCYKCHEYADVQSLHLLQGCAAGAPGQRGIGCWDCHLGVKGD